MNAIEFSTKIHQGIIKLPKSFEEDYDEMEAKVIVLFDEKKPRISQKDKLRAIFAEMKEVKIFSDIKNPVEWQKHQRDEWE